MRSYCVLFITFMCHVLIGCAIVLDSKIDTSLRKSTKIGIYHLDRELRTPSTSIRNRHVIHKIPGYDKFYMKISPPFGNYHVRHSSVPTKVFYNDNINIYPLIKNDAYIKKYETGHNHPILNINSPASPYERNILKYFQVRHTARCKDAIKLNKFIPLHNNNKNNSGLFKSNNNTSKNDETDLRRDIPQTNLYFQKRIYNTNSVESFVPKSLVDNRDELITSTSVYYDENIRNPQFEHLPQMKNTENVESKDINLNKKESTLRYSSSVSPVLQEKFKAVSDSSTTVVFKENALNESETSTITEKKIDNLKDNYYKSKVNKSIDSEMKKKKVSLPDILNINKTLPQLSALNNKINVNFNNSSAVSRNNSNISNSHTKEKQITIEQNKKIDIQNETIINDSEANNDNALRNRERPSFSDVSITSFNSSVNNNLLLKNKQPIPHVISNESFRGDIPN